MIKSSKILLGLSFAALLATSGTASAEGKPVGIGSGDQMSADFTVNGTKMSITRNQNNGNIIDEKFNKTSRPCPPFCIQPAILAPGVETIAELEVISYIQSMHNGDPVIVQDSRTEDWHARGHIPGTVSIPWTKLATKAGATIIDISEIMVDQFGVKEVEGIFDFSDAKTLVLYCNGMWCGQSPASIKTLLSFGYPAHKIKWYRGGMQDWEVLGLTSVK
ncbi:MAG: rhodanese-like domain-containing protein [Proteobacteria bacterium]|nr:rhodanese-like domain-containing protein [Pseudomonadota bacterium]